jgi:RsiW-degrading membrane proteinase PrsW (M82 family)
LLFILALIPVIGLILFIYFNDKKEKEPFGLLVALFFAGMSTVVSAVLLETAGIFILDLITPTETTILGAILSATMVVAPAEEMGKFLILRIFTWKNRHFNYSYDAIVYAVFISLGFAALENISYVSDYGLLTAIIRMLTAVPGHACYGVFMGFFYSKAKYAVLTNKKGKCALHFLLSIFVPVITHGIYDAILMAGEASGENLLTGISFILWIFYVTALFIVSFIIVFKSSRNDYCIVTLPGEAAQAGQAAQPVPVQVVYRPAVAGSWTCSCGAENNLNFCFKCGKQRSFSYTWTCPRCGSLSAYNFCGNCGTPRPAAPAPAYVPPGYQNYPNIR